MQTVMERPAMATIEVRELDGGRFEVYAEELHHEAFAGQLGAILCAAALAGIVQAETGVAVEVVCVRHSSE